MHPQIKQNEPGDCPLCGMDLIPLEENTSNDPLVLEMTNEAVKLANIQTSIVGETAGQSGKTIRLSGKVQPDERLASSQVAHVPGRIEKLFVSFTGEQVNKGQKIATLYSPELITAQRELLEALKLQTLNPELVEAARNKLRYWKIENATIDTMYYKHEKTKNYGGFGRTIIGNWADLTVEMNFNNEKYYFEIPQIIKIENQWYLYYPEYYLRDERERKFVDKRVKELKEKSEEFWK